MQHTFLSKGRQEIETKLLQIVSEDSIPDVVRDDAINDDTWFNRV